jgi:hypothetical protein
MQQQRGQEQPQMVQERQIPRESKEANSRRRIRDSKINGRRRKGVLHQLRNLKLDSGACSI